MHHVVPQGNGRPATTVTATPTCRGFEGSPKLAAGRSTPPRSSTHHHAIVETPIPDLSDGTRRILGAHATWFNARHGREGSVFGERFCAGVRR